MKTTIKALAEKTGAQTTQVNGFMGVLCALGKAKKDGTVPKPEGQRGRAATLYAVDDSVAEPFGFTEDPAPTDSVPAETEAASTGEE